MKKILQAVVEPGENASAAELQTRSQKDGLKSKTSQPQTGSLGWGAVRPVSLAAPRFDHQDWIRRRRSALADSRTAFRHMLSRDFSTVNDLFLPVFAKPANTLKEEGGVADRSSLKPMVFSSLRIVATAASVWGVRRRGPGRAHGGSRTGALWRQRAHNRREPPPTETSKAIVIGAAHSNSWIAWDAHRRFWSRAARPGCVHTKRQYGARRSTALIMSKRLQFRSDDPATRHRTYSRRALQSFGVSVERQVELIGFKEVTNGVEAQLRHADGHEETVSTPWLIGSDGAHSTVRHALMSNFPVRPGRRLAAGRRPPARRGAPAPDELAIYLHIDGPFLVFPIPEIERVSSERSASRIRLIRDPIRPSPTLRRCWTDARVRACVSRIPSG